MVRMNNPTISRLAALQLALSFMVSVPTAAADIPPTAIKLPAMLVGCRAIEVPVGLDEDEAVIVNSDLSSEAVFETERTAWTLYRDADPPF
jgi:hypothetical protein